MKICMICEGSYPFVSGGVSSWLHDLILSTPQHEYVLWTIGAQERQRGKYAYTLPPNVTRVDEIFLDSVTHLQEPKRAKPCKLTQAQAEAFGELIACRNPDWQILFEDFGRMGLSCISLLSDRVFLEQAEALCLEEHPHVCFTDFFWTVRSMFLPLLYLLGSEVPQADLYHSVSTGYAGVLGAMAAHMRKKPYVLTEHGIYTREREEEIIRTDWVPRQFKDLWVDMFYMLARCAYDAADCVTALSAGASLIQQEIGCDAGKCRVIQNGVKVERFASVPPKAEDGWTDIGAIVRVVPVKDIKTMLYAFAHSRMEGRNLRLHIIGPVDEDETYYEECRELIAELELTEVIFTGRVDVAEYLEKIDFTLLTSISEGQPLSMLEGFAAGRPAIATDVGCCRELIAGADDGFGEAGICVPVMHQTALAEAIVALCEDPEMRKRMGENGRRRVKALFGFQRMHEKYLETYDAAAILGAEKWKK